MEKKERINSLTTTLSIILGEYEELQKSKLDPSYCLKKQKYEYITLNDNIVQEIKELLKDPSDFMNFRDEYNRLIMYCFTFNTETIKLIHGKEISIKPYAGEFLTQITRMHPEELEMATILYISTGGDYIGNTTLQFLEDCADIIKDNPSGCIIVKELKKYLSLGGMTQPGIEGIIPFRDDKKKRIEKIIKQLSNPCVNVSNDARDWHETE